MRFIPLTQGKYAIVDDEDYDLVNKHKWYYTKSINHCGALTKINGRRVSMHRLILGLKRGDGKQVDHKNHNPIDNRRINIRICTNRQNCYNRRPRPNTTSKYKGVCWAKNEKRWKASIKGANGYQTLGYFKDETLAAYAYDKKAKELFGDFAYLNFS